MDYGSKPFSFSLADGAGALRDAALLVLSFLLSWLIGMEPEASISDMQGALGILVFAAIKAIYKFFMDTQRVSAF